MLNEMSKLWKLADRRMDMNIFICDDEALAAEKNGGEGTEFCYAEAFERICCKIHGC